MSGLFKKKTDKELDEEIVKLNRLENKRLIKERLVKVRNDKINKINELRLKNTRTGKVVTKVVSGMQKFADKVDKYYNDDGAKQKFKPKKKSGGRSLFGEFKFD